MEKIATIGLDIAKSVFQVHGIDAVGEVVVRKRLSRARVIPFFAKLPRCLVGIEACNTSHYWARELIALGHDVRLMPAQYVKPYVKRGKNDTADAEAICEAVTRPTMRFVAVKQSVMMLHRVRLMLNRQRTQLSNAMRAHMSEFGIVAPVGCMGLERLLAIIADGDDESIPGDARLCLEMLGAQLAVVKEQVIENDRRIRASACEPEVGRRLMEISGVGPLLASSRCADASWDFSIHGVAGSRAARFTDAQRLGAPRKHETFVGDMGSMARKHNYCESFAKLARTGPSCQPMPSPLPACS